jgi:hypothetical protein
MKKKWLITFVLLVALSALSVIGASAADETTTDPTYPCTGYGTVGGRMRGGMSSTRGTGLLHDYVVSAAAESLDLTEAEVEDALLTGSTLCQLALDNGIASEDLPTFLQDVHETALDQAVIDGVITEAQAELMKERMLLRGTGSGGGARGGRGMMGSGSCLRIPTTP